MTPNVDFSLRIKLYMYCIVLLKGTIFRVLAHCALAKVNTNSANIVINKTFFVFNLILIKLGEVVAHMSTTTSPKSD